MNQISHPPILSSSTITISYHFSPSFFTLFHSSFFTTVKSNTKPILLRLQKKNFIKLITLNMSNFCIIITLETTDLWYGRRGDICHVHRVLIDMLRFLVSERRRPGENIFTSPRFCVSLGCARYKEQLLFMSQIVIPQIPF